jgi:hypothetical protein
VITEPAAQVPSTVIGPAVAPRTCWPFSNPYTGPVYATPNWTAPSPVLPSGAPTTYGAPTTTFYAPSTVEQPTYAVPATAAPATNYIAPTTTYYAPQQAVAAPVTYLAPVTTFYRAPPPSPYYSGFVQPMYFPRGWRAW